MSRKRTIIEVEPGSRIRNEAFATAPMVCPYCNGRGGFAVDRAGGAAFESCPDCEGTGEVIALVTIDWKPNKK